jgi:thymidylate synthase (FAD)
MIPITANYNVLGDGIGSIELMRIDGSPEDITQVAGICVGKDDTRPKPKLLQSLVDRGHTTPLEFMGFVFRVKCPLFVRSQWHRHRTQSYNELSRRYCDEHAEPLEYYIKEGIAEEARMAILNSAGVSTTQYRTLIRLRVKPEDARAVLSQNVYTTFWVSVDLNNLLGFIKLRTDSHAQWEIRQYAEWIVEVVGEKTGIEIKKEV